MKINKPWVDKGEFLTNYKGKNIAIVESFYRITSQKITFKKSVIVDGGFTERCCFEITLLERKFLIVLYGDRIYEIFEDGDEKVFIKLTSSWIFIIGQKQEDKNYIVHGRINLHYQFSRLSEFVEPFIFQIVNRQQKVD